MKNKKSLENISQKEILEALEEHLSHKTLENKITFHQDKNAIRIGNREFKYFFNRNDELCFAECCYRNGKQCILLLPKKNEMKKKKMTTLKGHIKQNKAILGVIGGLFLLSSAPVLLHATPSYAAMDTTYDFDTDLDMKKIIIDSSETIDPFEEKTNLEMVDDAINEPILEEVKEEELENPFIEDASLFYQVPCPLEMQEYIYQKCLEYQVPFRVVMPILHQESGGNFNNHGKLSKTNDYGYMQINRVNIPAIEKKFGYTSDDLLNNDYKNIEAGIWLLSDICKMYDANDFENIFGTYNGWKNWKQKEMSRKYVESCMNYLNQIYVPLEMDETVSSNLAR